MINSGVWTAYVDCSGLNNTGTIYVDATAYADNGTATPAAQKTVAKETRTVISAVTASAFVVTGAGTNGTETTPAAIVFADHVSVTFDKDGDEYDVATADGVFTDDGDNAANVGSNDYITYTIVLTAKDGYVFDSSINAASYINGMTPTGQFTIPTVALSNGNTVLTITLKDTVA